MNKLFLSAVSTIPLFFVTIMGINTQVKAANISLDFNSLPTEQGWEFWRNAYSPPNPLFSLDEGVLKHNTIGQGRAGQGFELNDVVNINESFTLSFTARVLREQIVISGYNIPFGFRASVQSGTQTFAIGLGINKIGIGVNKDFSSPVDNSEFNDYRLEGSFVTGSASLYINDNFIRTILPFSTSLNNSLLIGDGTQTRNAQAELKSFTFTQGSHAVPEPLTILGTGVAIGFGSFFKHKLNQKK